MIRAFHVLCIAFNAGCLANAVYRGDYHVAAICVICVVICVGNYVTAPRDR